jgi:DNA-binding LacI/PurR family transcriptional regulator
MSEFPSTDATGRRPGFAVFAANDVMAIGAMRALKDHGVDVPTDLVVIGFDDIELARIIEPALSTVDQPAFEMGTLSAGRLPQPLRGRGRE